MMKFVFQAYIESQTFYAKKRGSFPVSGLSDRGSWSYPAPVSVGSNRGPHDQLLPRSKLAWLRRVNAQPLENGLPLVDESLYVANDFPF